MNHKARPGHAVICSGVAAGLGVGYPFVTVPSNAIRATSLKPNSTIHPAGSPLRTAMPTGRQPGASYRWLRREGQAGAPAVLPSSPAAR